MSGVLVPLVPQMTKAKMSCHNWDPLAPVPGVTPPPPPPPESLSVSKDLVQHCLWQPEPIANTSRAEATNVGTTAQQKTLKALVKARTPSLTEKDLGRQCKSPATLLAFQARPEHLGVCAYTRIHVCDGQWCLQRLSPGTHLCSRLPTSCFSKLEPLKSLPHNQFRACADCNFGEGRFPTRHLLPGWLVVSSRISGSVSQFQRTCMGNTLIPLGAGEG